MQFYYEFLYFHERRFNVKYFTFIVCIYIFEIIIQIKSVYFYKIYQILNCITR